MPDPIQALEVYEVPTPHYKFPVQGRTEIIYKQVRPNAPVGVALKR
jgi:hypothetical protein